MGATNAGKRSDEWCCGLNAKASGPVYKRKQKICQVCRQRNLGVGRWLAASIGPQGADRRWSVADAWT